MSGHKHTGPRPVSRDFRVGVEGLAPPSPLALHAMSPPQTPVTWLNAVSGNWTSASNWSTGTAPDASNDVTISATGGKYTVTISTPVAANSLTVSSGGATVDDTGTLALTTNLLLTAGKFVLDTNGLIQGGTLASTGGTFSWTGGTLSGATYQGALTLDKSNNALTLTGNTTLSGAGGVGAGEIDVTGTSTALIVKGALAGAGLINDTGNSSYLYLYDTRTLDAVTLDLGNNAGTSHLVEYSSSGHATLTLGPGATLDHTGTYALFYIDEQATGNALINQGTINATAAGGTLMLSGSYAGDSFTNAGSILVANGDLFSLGLVTQLTNLAAGTLTGGSYEVDAGSTLQLVANASVGVDAATLILSGSKSVIQSINTATGKEVSLDSTLYDIAAGGALALLNGRAFSAVANGGAFTDDGTLTLNTAQFKATSLTIDAGGLLSGNGTAAGAIVDNGTIDAAGGTLTLTGVVSGAGVLSAEAGATLSLATGASLTETVIGAGALLLGGAAGYSIAAGADIAIATLTLGNGSTLTGAGTVQGALIDAGGTIDASAGTLLLAGSLTGAGALSVESGAVLDIAGGGSIMADVTGAGTLQIDGTSVFTLDGALQVAQVVVNADATLALSAGGSIGGTISGAGALQLGGGASYTISAGTTLSVALLDIEGGALSGSGFVAGAVTDNGTLTASGGTLTIAGKFAGTGVLGAAKGAVLDLAGGGIINQAISGAGTLELGGFVFLNGASDSLTIKNVLLDAGAQLTGAGTIAGKLVDSGTMDASNGTLTLAGAIGGAGTLSAAAAAVLDITGGGKFAGAITGDGTVEIDKALTFLAGATLGAASIVDTANLKLAGGESVTNNAGNSFAMTVAAQSMATLAGKNGDLFTNMGSFTANGDGTARVSLGFVNEGLASVGAGTLIFAGALTNDGTVDAASGLLSARSFVDGTGTLQIDATGTLALSQGASAGETVLFTASTGLLDLAQPLAFGGVISGFMVSDQIDLTQTAASSFDFENGTLTVLNGGATVASLLFSGAYTNSSFALSTDPHGGTIISATGN